MVLLVLVFVVGVVWRVLTPGGDRVSAAPTSSGRPPLSGPPAASPDHIDATLTRLIASGHPVLCGGGTKPLVALTFDDGPGPYTRKVVRILRAQGARATFFIVARELVDWPDLGHEPVEEARIGAIGDHTYDHVDLPGVPAAQLQHEVVDAKALIEERAGTDVRLFRPPYGHHDAAVDHAVRAAGMLEVLWSIDSGDGLDGVTGRAVLDTVVGQVRPGAIVLMHENRGTTLHVLPKILLAIRRKGLHTVSVPELLAADPPTDAQLTSGSCR